MTRVRWVTATALALLVAGGFGLRLQSAVSAPGTGNRQLGATDRVTISARPSVVGRGGVVSLSGSVDSGRPEEDVTIQAKDCGLGFFRTTHGARTGEGGTWSTTYYPGISTTVRALWKGTSSNQAAVRVRAHVTLLPYPSRRELSVTVFARKSFWRRHVIVQRLDRRLGTWKLLKRVVLMESRGSGTGGVGTFADFNPAVPRGTLVRAVFPLSQARPCYLAGVSNTLRIP